MLGFSLLCIYFACELMDFFHLYTSLCIVFSVFSADVSTIPFFFPSSFRAPLACIFDDLMLPRLQILDSALPFCFYCSISFPFTLFYSLFPTSCCSGARGALIQGEDVPGQGRLLVPVAPRSLRPQGLMSMTDFSFPSMVGCLLLCP